MAGYCVGQYGCDGFLTLDGAPMNCPAWDIPVLAHLGFERQIRGTNQLLPTAPGQRSYPRRLDQVDLSMHITVNGYVNSTGTAYSDVDVNSGKGMQVNLDALWTVAFSPVTTGRGTRAAIWTPAWGGTPRTAAVQVTPLRRVGDGFNVFEQDFTFTMTVPAGIFV